MTRKHQVYDPAGLLPKEQASSAPRFLDADTVGIQVAGEEKERRFRLGQVDTPEIAHSGKSSGSPLGYIARDAAQSITDQMTLVDQAGGYGRKQFSATTADGKDVAEELAYTGFGSPTKWSEDRIAAAESAGITATALGLPLTNNPALQQAIARREAYGAAGGFRLPEDTTVTYDGPRLKGGLFGRAVSRGIDNFGMVIGGAIEYLGERTGNERLTTAGRAQREQNMAELSINEPKVANYTQIHDVDSLTDYVVETLGENVLMAVPDLIAALTGAGVGVVVARRAAMKALTNKYGAGVAERVAAGFGRHELGKKTMIGGAVGAAIPGGASGFVQGVGGMQARLKNAGIEDTGNAPLLNGLAAGGLNAASAILPAMVFMKAAGIGSGVAQSVGSIALDASKAFAIGGVFEGSIGTLQNAIEQSIHLDYDEDMKDEQFSIAEMLDAGIRSAITGAALNTGVSLAGSAYRGAESSLREYRQHALEADRLAAEKDLLDQQISRLEGDESADLTLLEQLRADRDALNGVGKEGESVGDKVNLGQAPSAVAGSGLFHRTGPDEVPDLPGFRYHDLESLLVRDGQLLPLQEVARLIKAGKVTPEEVVAFVSDSVTPKVSTVHYTDDAVLLNQKLRGEFEALTEALRNGELVEEDAKQKKAYSNAVAALRGEFRDTKGQLKPEKHGKKQMFTREENRVLAATLRAFGLDPEATRHQSKNYDWAKTYLEALQPDKPNRVEPTSPPKEVDGTPETRAKGRKPLAEELTAVEAETSADAILLRLRALEKELRDAGHDDTLHVSIPGGKGQVIKGVRASVAVRKYVEAGAKAIRELPEGERAAAVAKLQKDVLAMTKGFLKHTLESRHRTEELKGQLDAANRREQETETDPFTDGTDDPFAIPDVLDYAPLGDRPAEVHSNDGADGTSTAGSLDAKEVAPAYRRRTAFVNKVVAQLGEWTGLDLSPLAEAYAGKLTEQEQAAGTLTPGKAEDATVRLVRRGNTEEQQAAGRAGGENVRQVTPRLLASLKKLMNEGDVEGASKLLERAGLLPEGVGVDGKQPRSRPLHQKARLSRGREQKAGNGVIRGEVTDADGEVSRAAYSTRVLTDHGLRQLGYLDEKGNLDFQGVPPAEVVAEAFIAGLSELVKPVDGIAVNLDSFKMHNDTVVWQSPDTNTATLTWGDVRPAMDGFYRRAELEGVGEVHDINTLYWERSQLLTDRDKATSSLEMIHLSEKLKAVEERLLELGHDPKAENKITNRWESPGSRDASIAELTARYDDDGNVVGFFDRSDEHRSIEDGEGAFQDADRNDQHAFESREEKVHITELRRPFDEQHPQNKKPKSEEPDPENQRNNLSRSTTERAADNLNRATGIETSWRKQLELIDNPVTDVEVKALEARIKGMETAIGSASALLANGRKSEPTSGKATLEATGALTKRVSPIDANRKAVSEQNRQRLKESPQARLDKLTDQRNGLLADLAETRRLAKANLDRSPEYRAHVVKQIEKAENDRISATEALLAAKAAEAEIDIVATPLPGDGRRRMANPTDKSRQTRAEREVQALEQRLSKQRSQLDKLNERRGDPLGVKAEDETSLASSGTGLLQRPPTTPKGTPETGADVSQRLDRMRTALERRIADTEAELNRQREAVERLRQDPKAAEEDEVKRRPLKVREDKDSDAVRARRKGRQEAKGKAPKVETPAERRAALKILGERGREAQGKARKHGVGKFLHTIGNVFWRTTHDRINQISPWFGRVISPPVGKDTEGRSFTMAWRIKSNEMVAQLGKLVTGNHKQQARRLQQGWDDLLDGKKTLNSRKIKAYVDGVVKYVQQVDPTFQMDGPPVVLDMLTVQQRLPEFRELLVDAKVKDIDGVLKALYLSQGVPGMAVHTAHEGPKHVLGSNKGMQELHRILPLLRDKGFLKTDAPEILAGFAHSAARYAEWGRIMGGLGKRKDGQQYFDASFKYNTIMDTLHPADRAEMRELMAGITGSNAFAVPHWNRMANAGFFAATALRYLLFSGVASIPELAIAALRGRRGVKDSVTSITNNVKRLAITDRAGLQNVAESLDVVGNEVAKHAMQQLYMMDELSVGKVGSRLGSAMFTLNGQHAITNFTRKTAMIEGVRFLQEHSRKAYLGDKTSARYLKELHISPKEAMENQHRTGDYTKNYQDAIHQFVEQSIANPEAGALPAWMNDPRFAIFASLKKFVYGLFDRVHRSAWHEARANPSITPAAASAMGFVVVASALGALAEAMREQIKYPFFTDGRQQPMDWPERAARVFTATGLQAHWQLAAGPKAAHEYGRNPVLAALNPTLDWLWSDMADSQMSAANKFAGALPVVTQIPVARRQVAEIVGGE